MTRLPYGTFKTLTPEQQIQHRRESARRYHWAHRDRINAKNKAILDRWKITKPFVVQCKYCGNDFNAPRRDRFVCPDCHQKAHEHAQAKKNAIIARKNAKAYFMDKVAQLRKKGLEQAEIGVKLGVSQRTVSYLLLKMGIRTLKKHHRKQNI
ncbi:MAG: hypothetical protein ACLRFP_01360 [Alphaproteobacteria bacterium]